jgi:hypothetical protein
MLAELLRAHPHLRGTLVEVPATVARAAATFEAAGVADRVEVAGQSFFDPLPAGLEVAAATPHVGRLVVECRPAVDGT